MGSSLSLSLCWPPFLLWSDAGEAAESVTQAQLPVILAVRVHGALPHTGQTLGLHLQHTHTHSDHLGLFRGNTCTYTLGSFRIIHGKYLHTYTLGSFRNIQGKYLHTHTRFI